MTISTNVKDSGTWRKATNLYVKDSGVWRTIQNAYVKDSGSWRQVFQRGFLTTVHIASNTQNWVINTSTVPGWDGVVPLFLTLYVDTGVVVGSSSTGAYALTIPSLPAGSTVTLINNGYIVGKGGDGGQGNPLPSTAGTAGGPALNVAYPTTINNSSGVIGGGGGGGGAGDVIFFVPDEEPGHPAGFGGGGAGNDVGAQGAPTHGTDPTLTTGGTAFSAAPGGNAGGDGGNLGTAGTSGDSTSGGAAGAAIVGYGNISWAATGSILGGVS